MLRQIYQLTCDRCREVVAEYADFELAEMDGRVGGKGFTCDACLNAAAVSPPPARRPDDLTRDEAVALVKGLREVLYRRPADWSGDGEPPPDRWDPDDEVGGGDLVEWACYEMAKLGLVPAAGPVEPRDG